MDWKKMGIEVRWWLITIVLACLVYDFSSPALSLSLSVITDFMAMVVGAWRSEVCILRPSEFFLQFWVPGVCYRPFVCPFPWTCGQDWNGPSEPKPSQKGCCPAKSAGVPGGYGWEGSAEEETPWRRRQSPPTWVLHPSICILLGAFLLFQFYCFLLKQTFL